MNAREISHLSRNHLFVTQNPLRHHLLLPSTRSLLTLMYCNLSLAPSYSLLMSSSMRMYRLDRFSTSELFLDRDIRDTPLISIPYLVHNPHYVVISLCLTSCPMRTYSDESSYRTPIYATLRPTLLLLSTLTALIHSCNPLLDTIY